MESTGTKDKKDVEVALKFLNSHKLFKGGERRGSMNNFAMKFYSTYLFTDIDGTTIYDTYYTCKRHHTTILYNNGYENLKEAGFDRFNYKKNVDMPTHRLITSVMLLKLCPVCLRFGEYDDNIFNRFGGKKYDKIIVYPLYGDLRYLPVYDMDELTYLREELKKFGVKKGLMKIKRFNRDIANLKVSSLDLKKLSVFSNENNKEILKIAIYSKLNPKLYKSDRSAKVYMVHPTQGFKFTSSQVLRLLKHKGVDYVDDLVTVYDEITKLSIKIENWKMVDYYKNLTDSKELSIFGGQIVKYSDIVDSGAYLREISIILDTMKRKVKTVTIRDKKTKELISVLMVEGNKVIRTFDRHGTYISPETFGEILNKIKTKRDLYIYRDKAYPNSGYFKDAGLKFVKDEDDSIKTWYRVGNLNSNMNFISPMIDRISYEEIDESGVRDDGLAFSYEDYPLELWKV